MNFAKASLYGSFSVLLLAVAFQVATFPIGPVDVMVEDQPKSVAAPPVQVVHVQSAATS